MNINSGKGAVVSFSPDNKMVATGGQYDTVQLWNLDQKKFKPRTINDYGTVAMNFSNDGSAISVVSKDKTLRVWSTSDTSLPIKINEDCQIGINGENGDILNIGSDGKSWAIAGKDKNKKTFTVVMPDKNNCYPIKSFKHNDNITHAGFSPNGQLVVAVSKDRMVRLWNIKYKRPVFTTESGDINKIIFSFDGQIAALGIDNNTIELQDYKGNLISPILPGDSSIFVRIQV